jgi:hypothetical protein
MLIFCTLKKGTTMQLTKHQQRKHLRKTFNPDRLAVILRLCVIDVMYGFVFLFPMLAAPLGLVKD